MCGALFEIDALENESRTAQLHSAAADRPALPSGGQGTDVRTKPSSSSLEAPQKHPVKISQGPESQVYSESLTSHLTTVLFVVRMCSVEARISFVKMEFSLYHQIGAGGGD